MKALYFECFSGISGDMTVAALLDLGADKTVLEQGLKSLGVEGFGIQVQKVLKSGIQATDFDVLMDDGSHDHHVHPHEHEHDHVHPHEHEHMHDHEHPHEHGHDHHEHSHDHEHLHEHPHVHRGLSEILSIIDHSAITPNAKAIASRIFKVIAQAEASVHGCDIETVHFHEVGAIDSIVDIVSAAICLDNLGIEKVYASPLFEGTGYVKCAHGLMPVPAPATAKIMSEHHMKVKITHTQGEMVTPTGAAILAGLDADFTLPEEMVIEKTGMGAGKKEFSHANLLRVHMIETEGKKKTPCITLIQTNIDDATPEQLGYAFEKLMQNGAKDVTFTPIFGKKMRPSYQVNVLCSESARETLTRLLFLHTTTIGVRYCQMQRSEMEREIRYVETPYGRAAVKHCVYQDIVRDYVEYESAKQLAEQHNIPLFGAVQAVLDAAKGNEG